MPNGRIETVGDLIDAHHRVSAWCPGGHGSRPLDMNALIARLGRDWRYVGEAGLLSARCVASRLMIRIAGDQRGPAEQEQEK